MRQVLLFVLLACSVAIAFSFRQEGFTSNKQIEAEIELKRINILANQQVSAFEIMHQADEVRKMTDALMISGKKHIAETLRMSLGQILQPVANIESEGLIDWDRSYTGDLINFYYEEVEQEGEMLRIVTTIRFSPAILSMGSFFQMPKSHEQRVGQYEALMNSVPARQEAEQAALNLQKTIDNYSSNDDQGFMFESKPYESYNFVFSRSQVRELRSMVGPCLVLYSMAQRTVEKDVRGVGVRSLSPEVNKQLESGVMPERLRPTRPGTPTVARSTRQLMMTTIQQKANSIALSWPLAYGSYYFNTHRLPEQQRIADAVAQEVWLSHWGKPVFWGIVVLALGLGLQILPMSMSRIVREELESKMNAYPTKKSVRRTTWVFYRNYPGRLLWQPLPFYDRGQKTVRGLLGPLCKKEKDLWIAQEIEDEAEQYWSYLGQRLQGDAKRAVKGMYTKAMSAGKLSVRCQALKGLEDLYNRFLSKQAESARITQATGPEGDEEYVSTRGVLIAEIRETLPVFSDSDSEKFWNSFSRRDLLRLQEIANVCKQMGLNIAQSLFSKPDSLKALLAPDSPLIVSVRAKDSAGIIRILDIQGVPAPAAEPEIEPVEQPPLSIFSKVVIIGGRKVAPHKTRLLQDIRSLGAKKVAFIESDKKRQVSDAVKSASANTLFIHVILSNHSVENALKEYRALAIRVHAIGSESFVSQVIDQLEELQKRQPLAGSHTRSVAS
ncbi:MAG: hypothetical protein CMI53_01210 [Parcubacteria group bacterium]|nr:hypothetical protein [Parcubacteria group bacterium]